jgi:hypothetical protein
MRSSRHETMLPKNLHQQTEATSMSKKPAMEMEHSMSMQAAGGNGDTGPSGHLYIQTNELRNSIIHYHRSDDGRISEVDRVATGGAGSGEFKPISADPEATVIFGETLISGRLARQEAHVYDFYWAETEARGPDGTLLFADVLRLSPAGGDEPRSAGRLGAHDVVATLYIVTRQLDPIPLVALLRSALASSPDVLAGASELPNGCGAALRLLARTSKPAKAALRTAWNAARMALPGIPAPDLRKG